MEFLMRYINRTSRLSELYRMDKMEKYGLGGKHHTYILNICQNPGVSQDELASMIFVNKSNVARQLAFLEKKEYIRREKCAKDGRKMLVYPTDKAHKVYPEIIEILREWNDIILEDFTEEDKKVLAGGLKAILEKAKKATENN